MSQDDLQSPHYEHGVSCPHCHDRQTPEQRRRYAEREHQLQLAQARGEAHIGSDAVEAAERHRAEKLARKRQQQARKG